jgi:hypothetical protein
VAKPNARRLKVFQAQIGFYDTVVAAPSQAAALRAWGVHQNLFASGGATVIADGAAVAAALEHPETPLRRAIGSKDSFQLAPAQSPRAPKTPKRRAGETAKAPADRTALDAAEAALRKLDADRKREEADFQRRQEALEEQKDEAQSAYGDNRKAATTALVKARQAYRKAGGKE